ncbi:HAD-IA family hydrolase [Ideonella sp. DXS22W]|uniref:HAD-IA family hydrolase n=1 Tax=Pseudaquabacterium inlustre TaxID=2984192 RepID=A0ABU9CEZ4_9BURK
MSAPDIRAVIWDYGGVITRSPFEAFARLERERGLPAGFLRQVNATNHLDNAWARFERSEIDLDAFNAAFAAESAALGHAVPGREVIALLGGEIRPEMVQALRRLRPRLKLGLITNNVRAPEGDGQADAGRGEVLAQFHHVIESAKVGLRKPDPAIYRLMLDALGVAASQAVFLDDLGVNLKPARALGMHTIKVGEPGPALAQLQALVGFSLD